MPNSQIKTLLITDLDEFSRCREAWNSLAGNRLFHSWEWMYSWWESWQSSGRLAIVVVVDQNDRWVGIAPWFKTVSASRGRVVRSMGSGAACSDYVSVAVRPGFEAVVARKLLEMMFADDRHEIFSDVDLFEFEGHTLDDSIMSCMAEELSSDLADVVCEEFGSTWRAELPESWKEFDSNLKKSFRRKTKKAIARLASDQFHGQVFMTPDEIESIWPVFADLHQRRRQSLGEPGCFADQRFEAFLKLATLRLAASARAQINLVSFEGRPITANLEFISRDSIYMYQTGMDPDFLSVEPGHITFTWAIRESINRQFRWFDFLRGDEPYKARWNARHVPLYRTQFVPNRLRANLRHSVWNAGKQMKSWARTVVGKFENQN